MHATLDAPEGARARRPLSDQNHHLWQNGKRWWIAFTVRHSDGRRSRIRRSLGTTDLLVARMRRDQIFARARASAALELAGSLAAD